MKTIGKYGWLIAIICLCGISTVYAANTIPVPSIQIGVTQTDDPQQVSVLLQILALMTVISLAPSLLILMTSFVRVAASLSFLRQAMGTHSMPPNQIIVGLALFLTFYIMMPVWEKVNQNAIQPYLREEITTEVAIEKGLDPIREFMFSQTRKNELGIFLKMSKLSKPQNKADVPTMVLIPAFVVSELKTAFIIGFFIYVPFLVIDMVVASVLLSMGMMMLPPVMVSLPFKLMLFVLVDGWSLIAASLVDSFATH
ncbi:MAG: flagellar type III secretion system pore protein FliP [Candidatus Magnetomorum sp.]|nr:flagellar type III secretion system pore protein FliP [Candidatus Magnetomorum sp.]